MDHGEHAPHLPQPIHGDPILAGLQLDELEREQPAFGGSTVVTGDILKIHVHTDTPEAVFSYAER